MRQGSEEMGKKKQMRARGVRFTDAQWDHLSAMAGKNSTPSDYNRQLVDNDIGKVKRKSNAKKRES